MSSQITVRLPEQTVDWLDSVIAKGDASSRAVIIEQALVRERLRRAAEADAAILAAVQGAADDDMDDLAAYAARTSMDDLA
ncbi:ribbon-helix-helix protein, CopG family [Nocardia halotolerans]|uniref:Ribbon-helix-helix protein, CopG family n=1 Tax=Nocardia halotolerans TaxID=1755878 RepID=A0ABV8VQC5_9NOCA